MNCIDIAGEDVADRADDHVAFFVDVDRCRMLLEPADDDFPQPQQVCQISREFFFCSIDTRRAHDKAEPFGRVEFVHHVAEFAASFVVFDLARDPNATKRRHQNQVAARDADIGAERGPLGADPFFDDLDQEFVATAENVLDWRLHAGTCAGPLTAVVAARFARAAFVKIFVIFTGGLVI